MGTNLRTIFKSIALGIVAFAACGTVAISRSFVKTQVGPFYMLDFLFVLWMFFAFLSWPHSFWRLFLHDLWAPIAFFLWGLALVFADILIHPFHTAPPLFPRIIQHSLLFAYPLFWMAVGRWLQYSDRRFPYWILVGVLLSSTLANLWNHQVVNLSIGSLIIVPSLVAFNESQDRKLAIRERRKYFAFSILLALFAFTPIWVMSVVHLQRSAILLLIFMILAPVIYLGLRIARPRPFFVLKAILFSFGMLLIGFFLSFQLQKHRTVLARELACARVGVNPVALQASRENLSPSFAGWSYHLLQHGEDAPGPGDRRHFQMRTRRFMWSRAFAQWREHPLWGIGFVREVPDFVGPNYPNTGGFEWPGTPPVSGPHNSYLSILARMGLAGMILFLLIAGQWLYRAWSLMRHPLDWPDLLLIVIPINGALYAFFNVGFESPHNCMMMWLAAGIILARTGTRPDEDPLRS